MKPRCEKLLEEKTSSRSLTQNIHKLVFSLVQLNQRGTINTATSISNACDATNDAEHLRNGFVAAIDIPKLSNFLHQL